MSAKRHRFVGLLCLGLVLLVGIGPVRAGSNPTPPPDRARWLPFDGTAEPARPHLRILQADSSVIELQANTPGCTVEMVTVAGQVFSRFYGEGYGHGSRLGYPDLPVLRGDVEVPFGAQVSLEVVAAEYADFTLEELGLSAPYPLQPPRPKCPGGQEAAPFIIDETFYTSGTRFPEEPVALGKEYVVRGHRVQPVEVWPVAYDPAGSTVRLYRSLTLRLRLEGSDIARTRALAERFASPAFEERLSRQILNYNQGRPAVRFRPDAREGYLIIVADPYYDAMLPFVNLRESRGLDVTMTRLSDIPGGGSPSDIQAYIMDAYWNWPTPPSYLLLVGDTDTIPGWPGPETGERIDLYYGCMDGGDDWHPEIARGRFPVRSPQQASIMVDKYLTYANFTGDEPWLKKAAFIATCDLYEVAEGTHNNVINNYTEPNGYTGIFPNNPEPGGDKIYCVTYNGSSVNITNAANDGRWAIIYSGHGAESGWADGQVSFSQSDVEALNDYGFFPFVAGHACNTGRFDVLEAFCETWVLQEDKGALVYWGSADFSYWDEDDILERAMFDSLFDETDGYPDVGEMTDYGLAVTEATYPASARYYWETYNVMGDPGVKIFMEPDLPTFFMEITPNEHELCAEGVATSSVVIESILGYSETVYLEVGDLPAGITATVSPPFAPAPYTATLTITAQPGTPAGDYFLVLTATDQMTWTHAVAVDLYLAEAAPEPPLLTAPPDGAVDQPFAPTLEWDAAPFALRYNLQLDDSPLFEAPEAEAWGVESTQYTLETPLQGGRCYWWHIQGDNACGSGEWAAPFHFATLLLEAAFSDNMEGGEGNWAHGAAQGSDNWELSEAQSHSPTHAWFVPDDPVVTDSRLWTANPVSLGAGSTLTFWHIHQFESSYDGAVLEISTNGGATWTDLGPYITANGYNGTISTCCSNPLAGRDAWVDDLTTWTQVEVDLSVFAGAEVLLRWRIGCDSSISDVGWYIDDVEVTAPLPPNPPPDLEAFVPAAGTPYAPTPVEIRGSGFIERPAVRLGEIWLLSVTLASSMTLDAVVPAGMAPGIYTATLYNGDCQESLLPNAFTIVGQCITPSVVLESDSPVRLGRPLHLTATLISGTPPLTYTWDMGGPGQGVGLDTPTPVFTYTQAGTYTAAVTVTNECGQDYATLTVAVLECSAPLVEAEAGPALLNAPTFFTATLLSGTAPFSYTWDMGGPGTGVGLDTPTPAFTYTQAGTYTAVVTVTNECGRAVASVEVPVRCGVPTAGLTSNSPVALGQPVVLTTTVAGSGPFTYTWDLGDGTVLTGGAVVVYTYTAAGEYTVTLTVAGACGQDVVTTTALVEAPVFWVYLPVVLRNAVP